VLCDDARVSQSLLDARTEGEVVCAPIVTSVVSDPVEMMRLTRQTAASAGSTVLLGTLKETMHNLALQGKAFDAIVVDGSQLANLPAGILAPSGRVVPVETLPAATPSQEKVKL